MAATMALSPPSLASLTLPELMEVEMVVSFSGGGLSRPTQHRLSQTYICQLVGWLSACRSVGEYDSLLHACIALESSAG